MPTVEMISRSEHVKTLRYTHTAAVSREDIILLAGRVLVVHDVLKSAVKKEPELLFRIL